MSTATDALLLSPRDTARLLAVSPRKLWSLTFEDRPGLPYVRIGRLVRYRPAAVAEYLRSIEARATEGGAK